MRESDDKVWRGDGSGKMPSIKRLLDHAMPIGKQLAHSGAQVFMKHHVYKR